MLEPSNAPGLFLACNIAGPIVSCTAWFGCVGLQFAEDKLSRRLRVTLVSSVLVVALALCGVAALYGREGAFIFASVFMAIPVCAGCLMRWLLYDFDKLSTEGKRAMHKELLVRWGYRR